MKAFFLAILSLVVIDSAFAQSAGQLQKRIVKLEKQVKALLTVTNTTVQGLEELEDATDNAEQKAKEANDKVVQVEQKSNETSSKVEELDTEVDSVGKVTNNIAAEVDFMKLPLGDLLAGMTNSSQSRPKQKKLIGTSLTLTGPSIVQYACEMNFTESSTPGSGTVTMSPEPCFAPFEVEQFKGTYTASYQTSDDTIFLTNIQGPGYGNTPGYSMIDTRVRGSVIELRISGNAKKFSANLK